MRGFEVVAGIMAAFFVIGIVLGVLLVVARQALHRRGDVRSVGWEEPPGPDGENPPPWPGRRG